MTRLDKMISDIGYVLDSLMALRNIYQTGSCNECEAAKTCEYAPKPGQMVRYNCPFYAGKPDDTEDGPKIDGGTVTDFTVALIKTFADDGDIDECPSRRKIRQVIKDTAKQFIEEYGE